MSMNTHRLSYLAMLLVLAACTSAVPPVTAPPAAPAVLEQAPAKPVAPSAASWSKIVLWDGCASPYQPCPTYQITLYPDDRYELDGRRQVRTMGASSGVAPGAWERANAALDAVKFDTLPETIERKSSDPPCMTDAPGSLFSRFAADGTEKKVYWSWGCRNDEMSALLGKLRAAFGHEQLVKLP